MASPNPYPAVIYLNQKYVFDILAMMESGFSQLETVKTTQTEQEDKSKRVAGDVGIKNVFSFLGISFSGERATANQSGESHERTAEKVYTPNSLFARRRE